jgi:hypothetical protein
LKEGIIGLKRTLEGMTLPETKRVRRKRTIYDAYSECSDEQETHELEEEEEIGKWKMKNLHVWISSRRTGSK